LQKGGIPFQLTIETECLVHTPDQAVHAIGNLKMLWSTALPEYLCMILYKRARVVN